MSRMEIISEISRLSAADRQAVLRRILEMEDGRSEADFAPGSPLQIRSLKGHRVLARKISQAELADEMFTRR